MKLVAVFLLGALLHASAATNAQTVTYTASHQPLAQVLSAIEQQTGCNIFYNVRDLEDSRPVTVRLDHTPLREALVSVLAGQPVDFDIQGSTVSLVRRSAPGRDAAGGKAPPVDTAVHSRGVKISGVVLTEAGVPIQGANVTIKQTEHGTITNAKGEFELSSVVPGSTLVFSFVGYASQSFVVKEGSGIRIYLKEATKELDKVVVQAYGTTTQRLTTSDIGKVTAEEIERQPVMNPLLALEGKVAGLDVNMTSGYASAPVKVELRGRATINSTFTSDPLYIIDGVPLTINEVSGASSYQTGSVGYGQLFQGPAGGQSPFFSINPADIESIEVLKDADATAIYGSRGANGVLIITTKKGRPGKTKFDLHLQEGTNSISRYWGIMNTSQYLAMRRQAFFNSGTVPDPIGDFDVNGTWDTTRYTNWQKVLFGGIGNTVDLQESLSGGDAHTTFRIGAGYNRTVGITAISGSDQRASISLNIAHHSLDQRLNIVFSNLYSYGVSNMISLPGSVLMAPDAPAIYDSLGNLNFAGWGGKNQNRSAEETFPFGGLKQPYAAKTNFLNSNLVISFELVRGMVLSSSFGYNFAQQNQVSTQPIASQNPLTKPTGDLTIGNNRNVNWIIEPQLAYNLQVDKGKFSVLLGASSSQNNTESLAVNGSGYISDLLINNIASAPTIKANDLAGEYRYFGVFGRMSYNWENKYVLNINGRRDGSSRFGPGKQFGNFGSVGAAWIASNEGWVTKILPTFFSFLKFRGSYGITGSDNVPDYSYVSQYTSNGIQPYDGSTALVARINPNPDFRWQTNRKLEGALNLGLISDRLNVQVAWYQNRCGNQLVQFPTPLFTGFSYVVENSPALVQNTGWEFTSTANLIKTQKFGWSITFSMAINRNKLVAYPDLAESPYAKGSGQLQVGQPLNITHVLHYIGIDPQTGQYAFFDKNHDGQINWDPGYSDDDSYPLDLAPKYFGGLGMNFTYGSLSVNLFFNFKNQIGPNVFVSIPNPAGSLNTNQPTAILGKQWQYPSDKSASIAEFSTIATQSDVNFSQLSDGANTNANFIRLSNLAVSYALPSKVLKKVGIQAFDLFLHTNNLFVITKYKGLDPETQNFGSLPPLKVIVLGANINL